MISADTLRQAWRERVCVSPIEPVMALTEEGLVLGAGTVLAKRAPDGGGRTGLALDGAEERLLALLVVAYGRAVPPGVIGNVRRAACDWADGDYCLALIHLARSGLPRLDEGEAAPFRLFAADRLMEAGVKQRRLLELLDLATTPLDLLKDGFDPDQPRVPAGNPDGRQWIDEDGDGVIPAAARQPSENQSGDPDEFFDTMYAPVRDLAQRLSIDERWVLGLSAYESGWLKPRSRELNNPFGVTHAGRRIVAYGSIAEAVAAWERRYGHRVQGASSAAAFMQRLQTAPYITTSGTRNGRPGLQTRYGLCSGGCQGGNQRETREHKSRSRGPLLCRCGLPSRCGRLAGA